MREKKDAILVILIADENGDQIGVIEKRVTMPVDVLSKRKSIECAVTDKVKVESDFTYCGYHVDDDIERYALSRRINIHGGENILQKFCEEIKAKEWQWCEGKVESEDDRLEIEKDLDEVELSGTAFLTIISVLVVAAVLCDYLMPG